MADLIAFLVLPRWSIQMKTVVIVLAWFFAFHGSNFADRTESIPGPSTDCFAQAKDCGTVCVTEADRNRRTLWTGPGDFKAQIPRQRPAARGE